MLKTVNSRALNHDIGSAKRAAQEGPVIITDRGKPAYVLMTYETFERYAEREASLLELLDMPGLDGIEFDPPRLDGHSLRPADLG
jgi:prevent-host-death family protein